MQSVISLAAKGPSARSGSASSSAGRSSRRHRRIAFRGLSACAAAVGAMLSGDAAYANITGFDPNNFTLNRNQAAADAGVPSIANDSLRLTTTTNGQATSAFFNTPQRINNFSTSFTYTLAASSNPGPADGFTFALHNDPRGAAALGASGGAKGYGGGGDGAAIESSAAVLFNNFQNSTTGLGLRGNANATIATTGVNLREVGVPVNIAMTYNGNTLTTTFTQNGNTFTQSYVTNLVTPIGGTTGFVGFTGGTGGQSSEQVISAFTFTEGGQVAVDPPRNAQDVRWNVQDGDWSIAQNWNPQVVPGSDGILDNALIDFAGTGTPTVHVTRNQGNVNQVRVNNNNLLSVETGGIVGFQGGTRIGDGAGQTGNARVVGSGQLIGTNPDGGTGGNDLTVGREGGTGNLTIGASATDTAVIGTRDVQVGQGGGSVGNVTQAGGTVTIGGAPGGGWLIVGQGGGTGTYKLSGGTINTANGGGKHFRIGQDAGSTGTLEVSGTGRLEGDFGLKLANGGANGTVVQSGGTVGGVWGEIGSEGGGTGTYRLSGGTFSPTNELRVGFARSNDAGALTENPTGQMTQTGGTVTAGWMEVGFADGRLAEANRLAAPNGTYNLSGNGTVTTRFEINIGRNRANGVVTVADQAALSSGQADGTDGDRAIHIGRGATGRLEVSGGTVTSRNRILIGEQEGDRVGTGTVVQTGGAVTGADWISIGNNGSSTGTYSISGGSLTITAGNGDLNISDVDASTGVLNVSGTGTVNATGVFVSKNNGTTGTVNQSGGTVLAGTAGVRVSTGDATKGTYNLSGGLLNLQGNAVTVGAGAAATPTGTKFNFTGGRLENAVSINFPAAETFAQNGGTLAPGAASSAATRAAGITTVNAAGYTQAAAGILEIDLNGTGAGTAGTAYDQLVVNGALNVAGTLDLVLGYTPAVNDTYTIIDYSGTQVGNFLGKLDDMTFEEDGYTWRIDYQGSGSDVVLTNLGAVPEPGSVAVVGAIGLVGLLRRRRPRRSSNQGVA